jgi:hypothetical protein
VWSQAGEAAQLLVYHADGLEQHKKLEGLGDAHHLACNGDEHVIVSTATNSLVWLSPQNGMRTWKAPGEGDCWHLNSVTLRGSEAFVCGFGRFSEPQGWRSHAKDGSGIVFELRSGTDVLTGLDCPHHPVFLDSKWIVCNSAKHEILQYEGSGTTLECRLDLGGWTRGLAFTDDLLFVGLSASRHDPSPGAADGASIAVLSRRDWAVLDRIAVPSLEIGDLVVVSNRLLQGVRRGAADAEARVERMPRLAPAESHAIELRVQMGRRRVAPDEEFECDLELRNGTSVCLRSISPHPVHISYHWVDRRTGATAVFDGLRTRLLPPAAPGRSTRYAAKVRAPRTGGEYTLQLTLVQEQVRWFDEAPGGLRSDQWIVVG